MSAHTDNERSEAAVDVARLVRVKAISKRWRKIADHRLVHDDGSIALATEKGWMLRMGAIVHGPYQYFDDARNFHANAKADRL